jgi:hypothetical protein
MVVVTRFNVAYAAAHFAQDRSGAPRRTPAWLKKRFELFEGFCLPSLKQQTDQRFTWLVLFSDSTPDEYRRRIEATQRDLPAFQPLFLSDDEKPLERFKQELARLVEEHHTHLVTMRIDNDDAYHREMVARTRAEVGRADDEFLNFPLGLQCDLGRGLLARMHDESNPFLSRVERLDGRAPSTVLGMLHREVQESGLLRDVVAPPMWLQVIHDDNVTNRFAPESLLLGARLRADFGMLYPFHIHRLRTAVHLLRARLSRAKPARA